eukprot:TRINITY_DN7066_c0_g1_i3.p1 TRINITY_DN7066_c0_g1~~TRINITY_DN7066_c0_g1_i3.p1  ORF type:complete len:144 (-),score=51.06 TRINITY_DN7066_c0_g1_i3:24-455(-)
MPSPGNGSIGALDWPASVRGELAQKSVHWKCNVCGVSNLDILPPENVDEVLDVSEVENIEFTAPEDETNEHDCVQEEDEEEGEEGEEVNPPDEVVDKRLAVHMNPQHMNPQTVVEENGWSKFDTFVSVLVVLILSLVVKKMLL